MWAHERHSRIVALLNERQRLITENFSAELGVSKETIRRDLIELELSGKLSRVHGGAIPQNVPIEASYVEREELHRPQKRSIARASAPTSPTISPRSSTSSGERPSWMTTRLSSS